MATATKTTKTTKTSRRDLSKQEGNPTNTIETHYTELMAETDPEQLAKDAIDLVTRFGGVSEKNLRRFVATITQLQIKGLVDMQRYLTNFMLAGSGMGTGSGRRWS